MYWQIAWFDFHSIERFFLTFEKYVCRMEDELIKNSTQIWKKLRSEGGMLEKLRTSPVKSW
jgi:hypothetical protein